MNETWCLFLGDELSQMLNDIEEKVASDEREITPMREDWYAVFDRLGPGSVRVICLGQDPYPTKGVATGVAFAVANGEKLPKSLSNIYSLLDIKNDAGTLEGWLDQGVMLLNRSLTCAVGEPNSHKKLGWWKFTEGVVQKLYDANPDIVFLLWGGSAISILKSLPDAAKSRAVCCSHPSPLGWKKTVAEYPSFYESDCFGAVNQNLASIGEGPIIWEKVQ